MEEHYIKDVGKITYVYGVNLEEHKTVIEKQQKRIAELEQELAELKEKAIVPRFKVNDRLFVIVNNEIEEYYVDEVLLRNKGTLVAYRDICKETEITEKNELFATKQEAQAKLQELRGGDFSGE